MSIQNVFSWSKSRDEQFQECQRKYYYDKYASWGGWDKSAAKITRLAYVYKNLKNRWAWKGETVHHVIEYVLKSLRANQPLSLEGALHNLNTTMRADFRSSKDKKYFEDPKRNRGLFEHEYNRPITDAVWKEFHDSAAECVKNFYNSTLYKELEKDDKSSWLMIEDLEEFDLDGIKIYVKLDFARKKDGIIEIYDWKTGKTDGDTSLQMGTYSLYAMQKWKVPLEAVKTYIFNVAGSVAIAENRLISQKELEETKAFIIKSAQGMKELLLDAPHNIPKPAHAFQYTLNTRLCDFCNFYKICEKYNP